MENNYQAETWSSQFGKEYTERNIFSPDELNDLYMKQYGTGRLEMNNEFLNGLVNKEDRILEVGCNVGNQLRMLQSMGYKRLYGIEIQEYAAERAKTLAKGINIIQGCGDELLFKDKCFKLVFTSGVLIHIAPGNIGAVMDEIYRCSSDYIWGFEYFAEKYAEVNYRGNKNLLWKNNFARLYMERFPDLAQIKETKYKYLSNENIDSMFLLKKKK